MTSTVLIHLCLRSSAASHPHISAPRYPTATHSCTHVEYAVLHLHTDTHPSPSRSVPVTERFLPSRFPALRFRCRCISASCDSILACPSTLAVRPTSRDPAKLEDTSFRSRRTPVHSVYCAFIYLCCPPPSLFPGRCTSSNPIGDL